MNDDLNDVNANAEKLVNAEGGFPAQNQDPPGLTTEMTPLPDHGEATYEGHAKLKGLKALITGGDSGIGRAVAIAYAREGADVALSYLPEEQPDAEDTASWVRKAGRTCVLLPGDLCEEDTARRVVRDAADALGGLDILVNNAGAQWGKREHGLQDLKTAELDRVYKTNIYAMFWVTQEALSFLTKGSSIINTTSVQAYDPSEKLIDYASTKAAINNFTVNLASELGERGIRVNGVAPGPIWTPLQPATKPGKQLETFGADTPLGRGGQPAELAGAYVFLASPRDASYVSATIIGVTGGKPVF